DWSSDVCSSDLLQQLLRLPLEHRVRESLERLAQHDVLARCRIERTEMQVRQFAGAPSMPPLRTEHDEIERVGTLDLEPARAAIARLVWRIERLRHQTLVAVRERIVVERPCILRRRRHEPRHS